MGNSSSSSSSGGSKRAPAAICKKPDYVPDFSIIKEAPENQKEFLLKVVDPQTGTRHEFPISDGSFETADILKQLSEKLGRECSKLTLKIGPPKRGQFASSHPGWDERIRMTQEGKQSPKPYGLGDVYCVDATVDEDDCPGYKGYPYF